MKKKITISIAILLIIIVGYLFFINNDSNNYSNNSSDNSTSDNLITIGYTIEKEDNKELNFIFDDYIDKSWNYRIPYSGGSYILKSSKDISWDDQNPSNERFITSTPRMIYARKIDEGFKVSGINPGMNFMISEQIVYVKKNSEIKQMRFFVDSEKDNLLINGSDLFEGEFKSNEVTIDFSKYEKYEIENKINIIEEDKANKTLKIEVKNDSSIAFYDEFDWKKTVNFFEK